MSSSQPWASPEVDMPEGYTPAPHEVPGSTRSRSSRIPGMHHEFRPQRLPTTSSGAVPKAWRTRNTTETDGNVTIKKKTTIQRDPGGTSRIEETVETIDRNPRRRLRQSEPSASQTPVRRLVATPGTDGGPRRPRRSLQVPDQSMQMEMDPRIAMEQQMARQRTQSPDPRERQRVQDSGMSIQDSRMNRQRVDPMRTRPGQAPGVVKKKSVETIKEPGRTVKVVKTSESVRPGPSRPTTISERAPRPIPTPRVARPPPPPARSMKITKSTTSVESGGMNRPAYKKRTKIVESTESMESSRGRPASSKTVIKEESFTSRSKPIPPRSGTSTDSVASSKRRPVPPTRGSRPEPPSKIVSRRKGDEMKKRKSDTRELERDVEKQLTTMAAKEPKKSLKATGAKSGVVAPPTMMTPYGPVETEKKVVSKKSVIRVPGKPEIVARGLTGIETTGPGRAEISEIEVQKLSPKVKSPESVVEREVIEVTSSVAIGGGFIETTRTISYDAPEPPPKKPQLSPQQVAQLVAEENAEIEQAKDLLMPELEAWRPATYPVRKHVELELLHQESVSILEQSIIPLVPTADEVQEEPQPEMIATIMSTEERGLNMVSPPGNVYDYLFSEEKSEVLMDVSSVAPAPLQDIVIPMTMQDQSHDIAMNPAVLQASMHLQIQTDEPIPEDIYVETVGKELPKSKNTARKGTTKKTKKGQLLTSQLPPWGIQNVEPVIDLVGASPAGTFLAVPEEEADEAVTMDPAVDGIEYLLEMEPPTHSSRVQLRGSQNPAWFPGYYLALPQIPDVMTVVKSPSVVFASAWKATQPDIFAEESFIVA